MATRGPLWSLGGAVAALLAAGPGREISLFPPVYQPSPAADAAIHLASQLAESVVRTGHDLAEPEGSASELSGACSCVPQGWVPSSHETHFLAFVAGALLWPLSDLLRVLRLAWQQRLAQVEARLLFRVRPPARP